MYAISLHVVLKNICCFDNVDVTHNEIRNSFQHFLLMIMAFVFNDKAKHNAKAEEIAGVVCIEQACCCREIKPIL